MLLPARPREHPKGQLIVWVLVIIFFIGLAAAVVPELISRRQSFVADDREKFEAGILAADLVEVGKYLLFYEKIIFRDDALNFGGGRSACMRALWPQSLGTFQTSSATLQDGCGYYDTLGRFVGTHAVDCGGVVDTPVFCPAYIRSSQLDGDMLESLILNRWIEPARGVMTNGGPGIYRLEIPMLRSVTPNEQGNNMIRLATGQKLLENHLRPTTIIPPFFNADRNFRAVVRIDVFTNAGGFTPVSSERFVKITGIVEYSGNAPGMVHRAERSNTVMMWLTTPKDFALFIPYPTNNVGVPAETLADDVRFDQSFNIGQDVEIRGRVFYDGDIRRNLANLPTFFEAVVLSGTVRKADGSIPGPADLPTLRDKFRKGFITNYSSARYLKDGHCAALVPPVGNPLANQEVSNGSLINCFHEASLAGGSTRPFRVGDYIERLQTDCSNSQVTINSGTVTTPVPMGLGPIPPEVQFAPPEPQIWTRTVSAGNDCGFPAGYNQPFRFLSGGFRRVRVAGDYGAILSPVEDFRVTGPNTAIYGTVLGGYVEANGTNSFHSLASLNPGLTGITNADAAIALTNLSTFNSNQLSNREGVTVPLVNMPAVLVTGDEAQ